MAYDGYYLTYKADKETNERFDQIQKKYPFFRMVKINLEDWSDPKLEKAITKRDYLPLLITLNEHQNKYIVYQKSNNFTIHDKFENIEQCLDNQARLTRALNQVNSKMKAVCRPIAK